MTDSAQVSSGNTVASITGTIWKFSSHTHPFQSLVEKWSMGTGIQDTCTKFVEAVVEHMIAGIKRCRIAKGIFSIHNREI